MSTAQAKAQLLEIFKKAMETDTREVLDQSIHIADLNKNTLIRAYDLNFTEANAADSGFTKSYNNFIRIVEEVVPSIDRYKSRVSDITDEIQIASYIVSDPKIKAANIWIPSERLLVSSSFASMSSIRTKIYNNPKLLNDLYFGITNRTRSIYESLEDKGYVLSPGAIPDESMLKALSSSSKKDDYFILPDSSGKYFLHRIVTSPNALDKRKKDAALEKVYPISINYVALENNRDSYDIFPVTKYIGFSVAKTKNKDPLSIIIENGEEAFVIEQRLLSVADIGHAYFLNRRTGATPASEKLNIPKEIIDAFGSQTQSKRVLSAINNLKRVLNKAHGTARFTFYNSIAENSKFIKAVENGEVASIKDIVVVTFQDYKINARLSRIESRIISRLTKLITTEILKISGSNTIEQDIAEIVENKVVSILTNKPTKKLKKHGKATGNKDINIKSKVDNVVADRLKRKAGKTSVPRPTYIRTQTGQFYSLVQLQNLLDSLLVLKIRENMGDGNRRDILNLRSGRLAESVKVERLSQSREGMITAFYTYMKNPYATFSEGGRQRFPLSRDPKLLISKSIREIAATRVSNKIRAVRV